MLVVGRAVTLASAKTAGPHLQLPQPNPPPNPPPLRQLWLQGNHPKHPQQLVVVGVVVVVVVVAVAVATEACQGVLLRAF